MASSLIDPLLQATAPPRAADPPRGADPRGTFAPVLDDALQADSRSQAAPPEPSDDSYQTDDEAIDSADVATADVDGSTADEQDSLETAATEDVAAASDDDRDDDEVDGVAAESDADVVVISAAAAVVVDAAVVPAATPVGDHLATAAKTAQDETGGSAASSPNSEQSSDSSSAATPTAIEIGDVRVKAPREVGEAPPNLDALKSAVEAAAEAAIDANKAGAQVGRDAAGAATPKPARGKAAVGAQLVQNAEKIGKASGETSDQAADDVDAAESSDGERSSRVKPAVAVTTAASDAAIAVPADGNSQPTTARSETTEAAAAPTSVAAVAAPSANSADASATSRSAAALARLTGERSTPAASGTGDEIDRTRFVGRVEGAIRTAQQRDGRVHVRLSPPELGALRIELTMQNGVLSARLEADTQAARNLLLDNLPALRERLAQQDVRIDQFDVDVRRDGGGASGGQQQSGARDRQAQDPHWRQAQQRQGRGIAAAPIATPSQRTGATTNAALDVRV